MSSVRTQDYAGPLTHLVIIDDCAETRRRIDEAEGRWPHLRWLFVAREPDERSGPARLAKLRNLSAQCLDTEWMSFLDDDNEFEPNHLASLIEVAHQSEADAVYSYDQLLNEDGTPFLERYWPWSRTAEDARAKYDFFCKAGVLTPGSNIRRHTIRIGTDVLWVDTNVWLFRRRLLLDHPIPHEFDLHDWVENLTEDDKMLAEFVRAGTRFACSRQPTVKYYLGGYSNRFAGHPEHTDAWIPA